jgi:putative methyltransferase (TIGR01177 family)
MLSGENLKLARLEAETLLGLENTRLEGSYLFCTIPTEKTILIDRLAFTRKVYEIIYTTSKKNLEVSLKEYPWINYYEKNFCVRVTSKEHYDERYYAGFVWQSLERSTRPQVNLDNPDLLIEIFVDKDSATVTRLAYYNFETFEDRKAHLRPVLHPTAMHPKMARALINILNPSPKEKILDPFCGACGILTEAGLMGLKFEGYDIDADILKSARTNLEFYNIDSKEYELFQKDSTQIRSLKNIVTDLPYGKSSKKSHELTELYSKFLKNISGRAVIVMPSFMPYKMLLDKNLPKSLAVINIIDHYVHKSLTRKIILIDFKNKTKNSNIIVHTSNKKIKHIAQKHITHKKKIIKKLKKKKALRKPTKSIVHKNAAKITKHVDKKHEVRKKKSIKKHNSKKNTIHKKNHKNIKKNSKRK